MFAICKDMVWQVQTWCLWKAKKMAMVIVVKAFHRLYGQENANYCCDRVVIHEFCVNLYRLIIIKVMRRYSLILVLFLLMGLPNGVMADNDIHYYVSPTGSDRANGTKQAPWKTLNNAFGKLQLPLRQSKNTNFYLHLQNGEYEIMQTVQIKGVQNGNTLTVCADEKGKARLVGNKIISNFTKLERQCDKRIPVSARSRILRANLYEFGITDYGVSVGDHQRVDLYCNGKRQPMARNLTLEGGRGTALRIKNGNRFDGNNVVVEYNKIENVVTESDDQGAFDMWGDASYRGVVVRYNHWKNIKGHDVCNKVAGIRLDDIISGVNIYGNVFENCGSNQFAAITIHGGKDNVVENNIFANCPSAVKVFRFDGEYWLNRMAEQKTKDQLFKTVNIKSKAYQQAYPELKKDIMSKDMVNTVKDNLVVNCNVFLPNDYDKLIKKNNHQLFAFTPLKSLMNAEDLK